MFKHNKGDKSGRHHHHHHRPLTVLVDLEGRFLGILDDTDALVPARVVMTSARDDFADSGESTTVAFPMANDHVTLEHRSNYTSDDFREARKKSGTDVSSEAAETVDISDMFFDPALVTESRERMDHEGVFSEDEITESGEYGDESSSGSGSMEPSVESQGRPRRVHHLHYHHQHQHHHHPKGASPRMRRGLRRLRWGQMSSHGSPYSGKAHPYTWGCEPHSQLIVPFVPLGQLGYRDAFYRAPYKTVTDTMPQAFDLPDLPHIRPDASSEEINTQLERLRARHSKFITLGYDVVPNALTSRFEWMRVVHSPTTLSLF